MNSGNPDNLDRLLAFLSTGIYSAVDIQQRFRYSQATISRMLAQLHGRIAVIGKARARRYTKTRDLRGAGGEFPVYKIDVEGNAHQLGILSAIAQDQFLWSPLNAGSQVFRSLPWFMSDLRPDGFAGRAFVRRLHQELTLPPRSIDWNEDHTLLALVRRGEDAMGSLVIGKESIERYFLMACQLPAPISEDAIHDEYPRLAQNAMDGQPAGSSAGGEQPKFTTIVERSGKTLNVLVKFSPPLVTDEGRRWADLLICEQIASEIIRNAGIQAAQSSIVEAGNRIFLEVTRFDRSGLTGRLPIISLRAIDNEFYGYQDNWINAANRMVSDGRLSDRDAASLRWLSVFGSLIGNNDQHFGNVSLIMTDGERLCKLAPAYDMLPMAYRPMDGAITAQPLIPPTAAPGAPGEWGSALACACQFWLQAKSDNRISDDFRDICAGNYDIVTRLTTMPRLVVN